MNIENAKQLIIDKVSRGGGTSFVEIVNLSKEFKGDYYMQAYENIILWDGLSMLAIDALISLLNYSNGHIVFCQSIPLVYMVDGAMLNLPIAKSLNRKYRKKHWFPVVFWMRDSVEMEGKKVRLV